MDRNALLKVIEANTIRALAADRTVTTVAGFAVAIHPSSDMVWFNYAVPLQKRCPGATPAAIAELRATFAAHQRTMRFEFLEPLWPELGPQLESQGINLQGRMPLMLCSPAQLRTCRTSHGEVRTLDAAGDDVCFRQFMIAAKRSFGVPETIEPNEIADHRRMLREGHWRSAFIEIDGQIAGVGTITTSNDELVGVATVPENRRHGLAAAISSFLVQQHFESGRPVAWLSAGDDAARAVYAKIGFELAGAQLNYIDEPPST